MCRAGKPRLGCGAAFSFSRWMGVFSVCVVVLSFTTVIFCGGRRPKHRLRLRFFPRKFFLAHFPGRPFFAAGFPCKPLLAFLLGDLLRLPFYRPNPPSIFSFRWRFFFFFPVAGRFSRVAMGLRFVRSSLFFLFFFEGFFFPPGHHEFPLSKTARRIGGFESEKERF